GAAAAGGRLLALERAGRIRRPTARKGHRRDGVDGMEGLSAEGLDAPVASDPAASGSEPERSPYARADLYDLLFHDYAADLDYYLEAARSAGGAVLDVGCGTGRVLLPCLAAGLDAEGLDSSPEMLERLRANAISRGLTARATLGDMRAFRMPRHYACVMIP